MSKFQPNKISIRVYLPYDTTIIKWVNQYCTSSFLYFSRFSLSLDCIVISHTMTCPPFHLTFSTSQIRAFRGITIYAGMPRNFAAKANAAAWLPLVTTITTKWDLQIPWKHLLRPNRYKSLWKPVPQFCQFCLLDSRWRCLKTCSLTMRQSFLIISPGTVTLAVNLSFEQLFWSLKIHVENHSQPLYRTAQA